MTLSPRLKALPKPILLLIALVLAIAGLSVAQTEEAQASPYILIYNHSQSVDAIIAYNSCTNPEKNYYILPGHNASVDNYAGCALVDVDPAGGPADVDSWYKKKNGEPWRACVNNEDGSSNPYNDGATTYRTFSQLYCPA